MLTLKVWLYNFLEERKVKKRFYPLLADRALKKAYQLKNPYQICRKYLQTQGAANIHAYGETPLTTMDRIVQAFGITEKDTVVELGAGRGRTSLFLAEYVGCKVIAVEQVPAFCEILREIDSPNLKVVEGDFFTADLTGATVIFLYGSMLSEVEIARLKESFKKIETSVKIITVSYPIDEAFFAIEGAFPWGKTEIYMSELANKKCVPCEVGTPPLTGEELQKMKNQLPDEWHLEGEHHIEREYIFKDFKQALAFVNDLGKVAEEEGHHPDILLSWGKVKVTLWTHKIKGLSESDFVLAAKTDALYVSR